MTNRRLPVSLMELTRRDLLPAVPGNRPRISCYKYNYVFESHRAPHTPRTNRDFRMRHLHGLWAFYRNRFYEKDRWYKARIEKPILYPTAYFIDPFKYTKSLVERLAELNVKNPEVDEPVDIGFPLESNLNLEESKKRLVQIRKKNGVELERAARLRKLQVDVDAVESETKTDASIGGQFLRRLAEHYGIFRDLFHPTAYFNPIVRLDVQYADQNDKNVSNPVVNGNTLAPEKASSRPIVKFDADQGSYWTLLLTNPDGNLYEDGKEVVHWLVCNIPDNRVKDGEILMDYMQPLPLKGTGYHRMVFVLFRQDNGKIDLASLKKPQSKSLQDRTFHTPSFYKRFEDDLTPAGLAFFQSSWDGSCSTYFHKNLDMEEPIYEYDWPKPYVAPQEEFPTENVPFNQYLDKYRDPKDIEKELFVQRLKQISPFVNDTIDKEKHRYRRYYPSLSFYDSFTNLPSWKHFEKLREDQGLGKYKAIYENRLE